jgi:hypothetical protein
MRLRRIGEVSVRPVRRSPPFAWPAEFATMYWMKAQFTYWKESDGRYLGYLNDYPDHWTQGENLDDLKEHLKDLYLTFTSEQIPGIRKVEELEIA